MSRQPQIRIAPNRWWVLAIVVAAQFMFVMDAFIVNVALPSILAVLGARPAEMAHTDQPAMVAALLGLMQTVAATMLFRRRMRRAA